MSDICIKPSKQTRSSVLQSCGHFAVTILFESTSHTHVKNCVLCPKTKKKKKKKSQNEKKRLKTREKTGKDSVVHKDGVKLCNFASDSIRFDFVSAIPLAVSFWPLGQKTGQVTLQHSGDPHTHWRTH